MERIEIFNVPFDITTKAAVVDRIYDIFDGTEPNCHVIYTPNPEIVMMAQTDKGLMDALKCADIVIPDGVGVVWASKFFGQKMPERVAGFDTITEVFQRAVNREIKAYFLGGKPGVAEEAALKAQLKFKGLKVVGYCDGYFTTDETADILEGINSLKPDILLVGLGAPKQEKWIQENLERLNGNVKIAIGVGGSFDVLADRVKRAPVFFQKLGLEWFYRLMKEPTRIKRMLILPVFALKVIFTGRRYVVKSQGKRI